MPLLNKKLLILSFLSVVLLFSACKNNSDNTALIDLHKQLAGELKDNKLYQSAIEEYQKILAYPQIDTKTRANINYLIAKIYFDNIKDYQQAAAYYVRARTLNPDASFSNEASKNLVASLEKMGNMLDAKRELNEMTSIDTTSHHKKGDVVVARVGGVPIWRSEIEEQIQTLPPKVQKQFMSREERIKFLQQYIGMELMYHAAIRENYGNDPDIVKKEQQFKKKVIVDKYLVDKVIPEVKIDTMDVINYYKANKDKRYNNAPYDSVKAQVFMDYQGEKTQQAFSNYIDKLAKVEKVEILDQNMN